MQVTKAEGEILKQFLEKGEYCFSTQDVYEEFTSAHKVYLAQLLSKMVSKGSLIRLTRGLYYIVPLEQDAKDFLPDWHLVAKYIMNKGKGNYYIGYYSALQIHQLITQPSLTEIIVTDKQIKQNLITIKGVRFQFVYHNPKRFFGHKNIWIDDFNKVKASDLEKTIIDCLLNPHYGGGMVEIGKAVYRASEFIDYQKLWNYFQRVESKVAMKRFGLLSETLGLNAPITGDIIKAKGKSISLFDTSQPDAGEINSHWGLKINADLETIRQSVFS
ncbi:MAG: type IV toxin-antitoxin system AbiEi family antitoxin domain-containing protein [Phaeodactylibacter sp.]|nr:type IV toxin-antitoxin system AbiEi family antitoxin domain-containing protein [Phaeodactylibacter sp.]